LKTTIRVTEILLRNWKSASVTLLPRFWYKYDSDKN
jgi:hypothetical protein